MRLQKKYLKAKKNLINNLIRNKVSMKILIKMMKMSNFEFKFYLIILLFFSKFII